MNVISIKSRIKKMESALPEQPVTRELIEDSIRSLGLDVDACWRFVCDENPTPNSMKQMLLKGGLMQR